MTCIHYIHITRISLRLYILYMSLFIDIIIYIYNYICLSLTLCIYIYIHVPCAASHAIFQHSRPVKVCLVLAWLGCNDLHDKTTPNPCGKPSILLPCKDPRDPFSADHRHRKHSVAVTAQWQHGHSVCLAQVKELKECPNASKFRTCFLNEENETEFKKISKNIYEYKHVSSVCFNGQELASALRPHPMHPTQRPLRWAPKTTALRCRRQDPKKLPENRETLYIRIIYLIFI